MPFVYLAVYSYIYSLIKLLIYLFIYSFTYLLIYLFIRIYFFIYLSIYLFIHIYSYMYLLIYWCSHLFIYLNGHIFICLLTSQTQIFFLLRLRSMNQKSMDFMDFIHGKKNPLEFWIHGSMDCRRTHPYFHLFIFRPLIHFLENKYLT